MDDFIYKSYLALTIVSEDLIPEDITREVGLLPSRSFRKGEKSISKRSGSVITKPKGLWEISSNLTNLEDEGVSHHISYFASLLTSKIQILKKYKMDKKLEVVVWVWIETDNAGIGLDLNEEELNFLNSISNRIHLSVICNKEIQDKS